LQSTPMVSEIKLIQCLPLNIKCAPIRLWHYKL